jgi:hypothetical protein
VLTERDDGKEISMSRPVEGLSGTAARVADWLTPSGEGVDAQAARRRGHYRLQIAVDTVAYAHNIPLRLLLIDRLQALPGVIQGLLRDDSIMTVLSVDAPQLDPRHYADLGDARKLDCARAWILRLAKDRMEPPPELPPHWLQGALALLPYVERKVWLTEMGNPLPAHALCRMQDHWALYVLMWTWQHADELACQGTTIRDVLGVPGLVVRTIEAFELRRPDGFEQACVPIIGPYFVADDPPNDDVSLAHEAFCDTFGCFIQNVVEIDHDGHGRSHTVPLREELADALATRIGLTKVESDLRVATASHTLQLLRNARVGDSDFVDAMTRSDWETVAALCAWLARWDDALLPHLEAQAELALVHGDDTASLGVSLDRRDGEERRKQPRLRLQIVDSRRSQNNAMSIADLMNRVDKSNFIGKDGKEEHDAFRIDRPERYFNRIRERQNAMWSSLVIAINNLLIRHGPREVYIGADEFESEDGTGRSAIRPDEAEHLLRGFGGRICRYLVSMTRADAATIYWLDYAQAPPRLVPAGDYSRLAQHRAHGHRVWEDFDHWAWAPGPQLDNVSEGNLREHSRSQAYRVAATAREDPPPVDAVEVGPGPVAGSGAGRRKQVVGVAQAPTGSDTVQAYYDSYPEPRPVDSIAVPLMVNGRVIGVANLLGLVKGQFEPRLFWPLRRAGGLAASCMNHQSQVWHMRRLNYIFARRGAHDFRRRGGGNGFNPLKEVSRCLANIFLCPAVHIWLESAANDSRLELHGYNWDGLFAFGGVGQHFAREFSYVTAAEGQEVRSIFRPFSSMAIDLWKDSQGESALGRFVQGHFDANVLVTEGYEARAAALRGVLLGADFLSVMTADGAAAAATRNRIFGGKAEGGYGLCDIMSFALVRPEAGGWKTVGVVTLHDKGYVSNDPIRARQPWDRGWTSVVAHMQTYLPYLFRQAEVLNNPEVDARRYLIHAGRAELIAVLDTMQRLRSRLEGSLAPGRGVRQMIDKVMGSSFSGDYRSELAAAQFTVTEAWEAVETAASPIWEQNLRLLANVMNDYRALTTLDAITLDVKTERIKLKDAVQESIKRFARELKHKGSRRVDVPENLELNLPGWWLRIVIRDLIHNVAKYATGDVFEVTWDHAHRVLALINEGPYQSDVDTEEKLTSPGWRGSAGRQRRGDEHGEPGTGDGRGQGLGLWGAKLMCGVMNIGFSIELKPLTSTIKTDSGGVQRGSARYVVRMSFPRGVIASSAAAAGRGLY